MNRPPVRRGGWFKAPVNAWKKAHLSARWSPENPAPDWWAEIDVLWQINQDVLPSLRDYAGFLGWGKNRVERLVAAAGSDLDRWARDKNKTEIRQQQDSCGTEAGQSAEDEPAQSEPEQDSHKTAAGQHRDTSRARSSSVDHRSIEVKKEEGESPAPQPQKESPPEPPEAVTSAQTPSASPESNVGQASPVPGPSAAPPAEGDLLPLLMSHLAGGHALQAARKLFDAGVSSVADAAALDEFNIGQIVGSVCKVGTLKALRAGGWVPPKERSARPVLPVLPAGCPPGVKPRTLFATMGKEKEEENGHQRRTTRAS